MRIYEIKADVTNYAWFNPTNETEVWRLLDSIVDSPEAVGKLDLDVEYVQIRDGRSKLKPLGDYPRASDMPLLSEKGYHFFKEYLGDKVEFFEVTTKFKKITLYHMHLLYEVKDWEKTHITRNGLYEVLTLNKGWVEKQELWKLKFFRMPLSVRYLITDETKLAIEQAGLEGVKYLEIELI